MESQQIWFLKVIVSKRAAAMISLQQLLYGGI